MNHYSAKHVQDIACQILLIKIFRFFNLNNSRVYRSVFRKVFPFGAIGVGGNLPIPHNITGVTEYTRIYGTCITTVVDYRPLPYVSVIALNQGIQLVVTGVNIVIINGAGAPAITSGLVVTEFCKQ